VSALGAQRQASWLKELWNDWIRKDTPTSFKDAFCDFERAAARYKTEHGRPAILVIDNFNVVARDPETLRMIQGRAKQATDKDLYKIVFVCSDGVAPILLRRKLMPVGLLVVVSTDIACCREFIVVACIQHWHISHRGLETRGGPTLPNRNA
jgi:hypothetical protein